MSTFEKVQKIIADQFEVDPSEITMDTHMVDDLGADSLDVVELSMSVEEEFDLTVDDDQAANLLKVGDIVAYIDANK